MRSAAKALLAFLLTAAVSASLLFVGDTLLTRLSPDGDESPVTVFSAILPADRYDPIGSVSGNVTEAFRAYRADGTLIGYAVTVTVTGYIGPVEVHTAVADDTVTVKGIRIGKHQETEGYGARIAEARFTDNFASRKAPFTLGDAAEKTLKDGTYRAEETGYDASGFRYFVEIGIRQNEITTVNWDAEQQNGGKTKKELSRAGEYVMSDTGLPWHSQAEIMERALLDTQDPARLVYSPDTGKTDAYAGATVTVSPFVKLATEAVQQATDGTETAVDGVSGATASSRAVVAAVNEAVAFARAAA